MNYAIAYHNTTGVGFSTTEPFIQDDCETFESAVKEKREMIDKGFRNVTIFSYNENKLPESITWDYVLKHKAEENG